MLTLQIAETHASSRKIVAEPQKALLPAIGPRLTFRRDEEVFGQGQPADYVYQVIDGVVRTCRFSSDGRRQIEDFHLSGEYFGLETGAEHGCSAEAVGTATVLLIRRSALNDVAGRDLEVARQLISLTMANLARTQEHVAMLGRRSALERVVAFLLDFANRSQATAFVELPMSRQEIGDYLALTIETVSRTFTQLESDGLIALPDRRRVLLQNRDRLRSCCA